MELTKYIKVERSIADMNALTTYAPDVTIGEILDHAFCATRVDGKGIYQFFYGATLYQALCLALQSYEK